MAKNRASLQTICYALGATALLLASCGGEPSDTDGTGGAASTGGAGTGGIGTGGASTGGASTGGVSTGGVSTGGASTGGDTSSGGSSTGGDAATGGGENTGGDTSSGGDASSGGDSGSGGDAATGGGENTGGDTGAGGGGGFVSPTEPNSIAYTGCSMANDIGNGYKAVGGTIMWNADGYQTGAMVVQNWVEPNSSSWQLFDQKMAASGGKENVKAIMVQICITSNRPSEDQIKGMIASARQHVNPGTHVYIVGQPVYNAGHDCFIAGAGGADWTDEMAQKMAADPSINENMSYLGKFILNNDAGEVSDGCHASASGREVLGEQAKAFFGG